MTNISRAEHWDNEYERKGIPSSFRTDPSGSVMDFLEMLNKDNFEGKTAIDIGCGTGRNSIALAQSGYHVSAFDFASRAIEQFKNELQEILLKDKINLNRHDVTKTWPIKDHWADIAIDTFCFKHQIPIDDRYFYISELNRCLRNGAMFLLTLADINDGYYKKFPQPELGNNVIVDPENNIPSVLYSKTDITELFRGFELIHYNERRKPSAMHGESYDRITHFFVFKKVLL